MRSSTGKEGEEKVPFDGRRKMNKNHLNHNHIPSSGIQISYESEVTLFRSFHILVWTERAFMDKAHCENEQRVGREQIALMFQSWRGMVYYSS